MGKSLLLDLLEKVSSSSLYLYLAKHWEKGSLWGSNGRGSLKKECLKLEKSCKRLCGEAMERRRLKLKKSCKRHRSMKIRSRTSPKPTRFVALRTILIFMLTVRSFRSELSFSILGRPGAYQGPTTSWQLVRKCTMLVDDVWLVWVFRIVIRETWHK